MSRKPRIYSATGIYHVMVRGINKQPIFQSDADCKKYVKTLEQVKEKTEFYLYAYCLMKNHVHLLIKVDPDSLETVMKRIGVTYASYYNRKYQRVGHLFQDRFLSETVESDAYFLSLIRYICQNPVKAHIAKTPIDYPWLGCAALRENRLLDSVELLSALTADDLFELLSEPPAYQHLGNQEEKIKTKEDSAKILQSISGCTNTLEISELGQKNRNSVIWQAYSEGVPVKMLVEMTGISKSTVIRILREPSPKCQDDTWRTVPEVSG